MERTEMKFLVRRIKGATSDEDIKSVLNTYALEIAEEVRERCIQINRTSANALYGIYSMEAMDLRNLLQK
jgi:hypothetical protein